MWRKQQLSTISNYFQLTDYNEMMLIGRRRRRRQLTRRLTIEWAQGHCFHLCALSSAIRHHVLSR